MSKIHKTTREQCLICDTQLGSELEYLLLHRTRRQTHVLCHDCTKGYIVPIIKKNTELIRQNLREGICNIACPGSYHSQNRNMCRYKTTLTDLLSTNSLKFLGDNIVTDILRIIYISMDDLKICCPKEGCGNLIQLQPDNWDSLVICNDCDTHWCRWCKVSSPYHTGMNCIEYENSQNTNENTQAIFTLKDQGELKFCRVCTAPITRLKDKHGINEGCNKVICSVCNTKSCWLCMTPGIEYDHFADTGSCPNKLWKK